MPQPEILKKIREEIYYQVDDFKKIINNKEFLKVFGEIHDPEKMKNPPKGYPKEFPEIELLKFRNYAVMHQVGDKIILRDNYLEYATGIFKTLYPFNVFFNKIFD